jgi:type VI secretion system secreted protein Hcp
MPGNAFICFDSVKDGESLHETNPGTKGWIEISEWSFDIEADTSYLKGGGAAVGKPQPNALSWSHYYDLSSPAIMNRIVQGKHFPNAYIVMLKQTGSTDGKGERYFGIRMQEVFITKVSSKGAEDGSVTQDVEMVFKKVSIAYKPQASDNPNAAVKGTSGTLGAKGPDFLWDIGAMNQTVDVMDLDVAGSKPS